MFISKLYLNNFKSIENEIFETWQRINGIIGKSGSSKTTILDAIQVILFGKPTKGIKLADLIGDSDSKFKIDCEFSHQEICYTFEMTYEKNTEKYLKFEFEGEQKILKNSQVDDYMNQLFDPTLTLNSAFSLQDLTAQILEQDPAERLDHLKKILLDKDVLDKKEAELNEIISNNNAEVIKQESELNLLKNKTFNYEIEAKIEDNRDQLKNEIVILKENDNKQKFKLNYYNNKKLEYDNEYKKYQAEYQDYLNKLNDIEIVFNSDLKKYNDYKTKQDKYDDYLKDTEEYNNKKLELQNKIDSNPITRLPSCEYDNSNVEKIQDKINDLLVKKKQEEKNIKHIQLGKCPECGADKSNGDTSVHLTEIENIDNEVKSLELEKTKINNIITEHNDNCNKINVQNKLTENYELELTKLKEPLKVEKPETVITEPIKVNYNYPVKPLFNKIEPEKIVEINYQQKIFDKEKIILDLDYQIKANETVKENNNKIKLEEEKNSNLITELESEIEKLKVYADDLKSALKIVRKELPVYIINKGITHIKHQTNKFFKESYDKYFIDIKANEKGEGIDILFNNGICDRNVKLASGAEKQIIATAFRVALCSLQDGGFFIADEIDSDADTEKSEKLLEALCNHPDFEQIIIISHNEQSKALLSNFSDSNIFEMEDGSLL